MLLFDCLQSRVDGHLLLDPTADESYREDASAMLAMMPSANLVGPELCFGASIMSSSCLTNLAKPSACSISQILSTELHV